jgi:hypothetical protein
MPDPPTVGPVACAASAWLLWTLRLASLVHGHSLTLLGLEPELLAERLWPQGPSVRNNGVLLVLKALSSWMDPPLLARRTCALMASFYSLSAMEVPAAMYRCNKQYLTVDCISVKMLWSSVMMKCSTIVLTSVQNHVDVSWLPSQTLLHESTVSLMRA